MLGPLSLITELDFARPREDIKILLWDVGLSLYQEETIDKSGLYVGLCRVFFLVLTHIGFLQGVLVAGETGW